MHAYNYYTVTQTHRHASDSVAHDHKRTHPAHERKRKHARERIKTQLLEMTG